MMVNGLWREEKAKKKAHVTGSVKSRRVELGRQCRSKDEAAKVGEVPFL